MLPVHPHRSVTACITQFMPPAVRLTNNSYGCPVLLTPRQSVLQYTKMPISSSLPKNPEIFLHPKASLERPVATLKIRWQSLQSFPSYKQMYGHVHIQPYVYRLF